MSGGVTERVFRKSPDIVSRKIAGETILVPVRGALADMKRIFVLNPVGEHIWASLEGNKTVGEIRDDILRAFDVDGARAEADLSDFIRELLEADLVSGVK